MDILNVFSFPALLGLICVSIFYIRASRKEGNKALPPSYPIVGSLFSFLKNRRRLPEWITELLKIVPSHTIKLQRLGGRRGIITANPANVEHILKTRFEIYPKGDFFSLILHDLLGRGIFNADGETWKLQRRVASFEFSTRSLRDFIHDAVHGEITDRLLPLLRKAAAADSRLDMQDVLQRFAFDNICKVAFGTDPGCLDISLPVSEFAEAFEVATALIVRRFSDVVPFGWRVKRMLNLGSEKTLRHAIQRVHGFAEEVIRKRKEDDKCGGHQDLLSRFLGVAEKDSHHDFLRDIVISFILAGRDTTSAALTWFFWLLSSHPQVEERINGEIARVFAARGEKEASGFCYEELKEMNYLHAAICESMRLYPPVPSDTKEASEQDVLPDGTVVSKGTRVTYHPYAMGRMESIWGKDCLEFKPERWLKEDETGSAVFVSENSFKYPVFQAGPRICLGKEMAFIQMKCIAASVIEEFRFQVDPNLNPKFIVSLTAKMENGLPVVVEKK
uniref:TSA: Wollemia nobilis Ref_Wollemi_Transcript_14092_1702 transcribed RNA sequence n=1 Tax=Wollemia nobilis TaxID=56998 RepID=A0A0C9RT70_9CONI